MTRDDWYELHRPARRFDEDRPSLRQKAGIVIQGTLTFLFALVFIVYFLVVAGGTT